MRKYFVVGGRYSTPEILAALGRCDVKAFARQLKRSGYYTADEGEYAASVGANLVKVERVAPLVPWVEFSGDYGAALMARIMGAT